MQADSLVADCSSFNAASEHLTFSPINGLPVGATASVNAGGEYIKPPSCPTYRQSDLNGVKVTIEWDGQTWVAVVGDLPNYTAPTCDESYGLGNAPSDCGPRIEAPFYVYGQCGEYLYFSSSNEGLRLAWDDCRFQWVYGISITRMPNFNPLDVSQWAGYQWRSVGQIPVDDDGYPEGEAAMTVASQLYPVNVSPEITVTFSRVLP
jgi:hypothetical protein